MSNQVPIPAATPIQTDVVIIGAGPCGLFQVFELGLLGIRAHVVESLDRPGGQCTELYPDKPIYDIPALPAIGAQQMVDNLLEQIAPFDPVFHFSEQVVSLEKIDQSRFRLMTAKGTTFITRSVVVAAGVGSFEPVKLRVKGVDQYVDRQLFYSVKQPQQHYGKDIVVLGGGDSALDWTLDLYTEANSLVLIHRSDHFKASQASVEKMRALSDDLQMQWMIGNVSGIVTDGNQLLAIQVAGADGITRKIELDHLLVFYGLSPKLGPVKDWGLAFHKNQIIVDTEKFQSSIEGVFSVGDINWYPGKKKLILSGFHEAALTAFAVAARLNPEAKTSLQYTTTSSAMHKRLGVNDPYSNEAAA